MELERWEEVEQIYNSDSGQIKILGFGLARLVEKADTNTRGDPSIGLQEISLHTEEGTILGTVTYMSPEQAQGKRLDPRSGIFSFGAVLYEEDGIYYIGRIGADKQRPIQFYEFSTDRSRRSDAHRKLPRARWEV